MCVLLITRLLRGVGRLVRKPVNHTSWVAVVTPTLRPKSVRNCCLIELFCGVVCVATLPLWHFCWYRGFCHRTGSDLLLFVCTNVFGMHTHLMKHRANDLITLTITFILNIANLDCCHWGIRVLQTHLVTLLSLGAFMFYKHILLFHVFVSCT